MTPTKAVRVIGGVCSKVINTRNKRLIEQTTLYIRHPFYVRRKYWVYSCLLAGPVSILLDKRRRVNILPRKDIEKGAIDASFQIKIE